MYFIFSPGYLRYCDSGRCRSLPFFLTFLMKQVRVKRKFVEAQERIWIGTSQGQGGHEPEGDVGVQEGDIIGDKQAIGGKGEWGK